MLKIKSILVSLLVVAALASCSNENLEENPEVEGGAGYDVAYVSISLTNPKVPGSRASGEQTALEEESAINELYLITFNASKVVTKDEKATKYATVLGSSSFGTNSGVTTPNTPVKVDPNTKYLLVIANPGYQLKDRLDNLSAGATYTTINGMITVPENNTKPNNAYLVEEVVHSNGCAMINVGFYDDSDSDPSNHAWKDECLLDVSDKIVLVSDYKSECRKTDARKEEADVSSLEEENRRKKVDWLEDRLAQRDEKIDGLYIELRKEQEEKIDWIHKCHEVELAQKESEVKKCEIRGCVKRIPPSEY